MNSNTPTLDLTAELPRVAKFLLPAEVIMKKAGLPAPLGSVNSGNQCACRRRHKPRRSYADLIGPCRSDWKPGIPAGVAVEPMNSGVTKLARATHRHALVVNSEAIKGVGLVFTTGMVTSGPAPISIRRVSGSTQG